MEQPIKCDTAILSLLQKVEKKHIDYLVDVLTDNGRGRVALSSSIKDLLIDEKNKNYSEEGLRYLLNELQAYGGHSVVNIFRKEPLPYAALLTDVHKRLNGLNSNKKSDTQKEREIVLSLFGNEWLSMGDFDRWERCTETKVVSGFFRMQDTLNFNENGIAISALSVAAVATRLSPIATRLSPVVTALYLASKSIGEAYRITIPFVAHIAMLKMIYSHDTAK